MKKINWLILIILVCLTVGSPLFAEDIVSIMGCYYPRWSPTGEEIGFAARVRGIEKNNEELTDKGYGSVIAAINQNDFSIRYITPITWSKDELLPNSGSGPLSGSSRYNPGRSPYKDKEDEKERNIGDYNANSPTKEPSLVPMLFAGSTIFDWSTDGEEMFFYDVPSIYYPQYDLYMWRIKSDGTNLRPISRMARENLPKYLQCLNNGKIAIIPGRNNALEILNNNGKKQSQTTVSGILSSVGNEGIGLSKDGKKIAIIGHKDKNIYIKETSNSKAFVNLTKSEKVGECSWPSWSPDGKKIVFIFEIKFDGKINFLRNQKSVWVIDADGKNCRPLTAKAQNQENNSIGMKDYRGAYGGDYCPSWSPDGNKIVFLREMLGVGMYGLWIMNPDGFNQTCLPTLPGERQSLTQE